MRILFLSQIIPYPLDAGPKVKTWHVLGHLANKGHEITLVSFVRDEETPFVDDLRSLCAEVYTIPIHRSRLTDLLYWIRSVFSGRPFLVERDDIPAMRSLVADLLQSGTFDVVHADQLTMTQFLLPEELEHSKTVHMSQVGISQVDEDLGGISLLENKSRWIFDAHNATWTIMRRMQEMSRFYLRPFLSREAEQLKLYEGMIAHNFDHTLAVSEVDRVMLSEAEEEYCGINGVEVRNPTRIHVIPIAVDSSAYKRNRPKESCANILAIGSLHYPPNADGIRWFLRDVFPTVKKQIPNATLTIIGKNPPSDIVSLAALISDDIKVKGYVPDLHPYLESANTMVVPVRAGGGMRVRILEGMAWGIPMVTTTIGLEGIAAIEGRDILVANDNISFAKAVCSLLQSENLRSRIIENGLQVVRDQYDWQVVLSELDQIYAWFEQTADD